MTSCIFCQIMEGKAASSKVYEDEICLAFMDIQPVNPGHVLVIPKKHFTDLSDLPADIGSHLFQVAQRIAVCMPKTGIKSEGIDLFLANGEAAGQEIFTSICISFRDSRGMGSDSGLVQITQTCPKGTNWTRSRLKLKNNWNSDRKRLAHD